MSGRVSDALSRINLCAIISEKRAIQGDAPNAVTKPKRER